MVFACFHAGILLSLFDPEDGGVMFLRNVDWLSTSPWKLNATGGKHSHRDVMKASLLPQYSESSLLIQNGFQRAIRLYIPEDSTLQMCTNSHTLLLYAYSYLFTFSIWKCTIPFITNCQGGLRGPECHLLEVTFYCFRINKGVMPTNTTLQIWNGDGSVCIYLWFI
jgi:hypothetical protein